MYLPSEKPTRAERSTATPPEVASEALRQPAYHPPPMQRMGTVRVAKVLLVTSSLGSGHWRATQAIELALAARADVFVKTLDYWSLMDHQVAGALRAAYLQLVQQNPELYQRVFQLDQDNWRAMLNDPAPMPAEIAAMAKLVTHPLTGHGTDTDTDNSYPSDRHLVTLLQRVLLSESTRPHNRLARLILVRQLWQRLQKRFIAYAKAFNPDVVVVTQMVPAAIVAAAKTAGGIKAATIGVLTDFGVHDFWLHSGIDVFCLGHPSLADLSGKGVAPERVQVTGLPLMPDFAQRKSKKLARMRLGLDQRRPVIAVAGGGLGLGVVGTVDGLLAARADCQLLVAVGRNEVAHAAVLAAAQRHPDQVTALRWTERMATVFDAADLVVGKPGGLTVAEAMACGCPLIATHSLQGQENFNVRFLEANGAGKLVAEHQLAGVVSNLLEQPRTLRDMQSNATRVGARDGAQRIAELVFVAIASPRRTLRRLIQI